MSRVSGCGPELPLDPDATVGPSAREAGADVRVYALVAVGGALGSLGRYEVGNAFPTRGGQFPTATLGINVAGSFLLAMLLVVLVQRLDPAPHARALFAVGVLGAFTTFSTFAVAAVDLARDGHEVTAVAYVLVSLLAGLVAAGAGLAVGRGLPERRLHADRPAGGEGS